MASRQLEGRGYILSRQKRSLPFLLTHVLGLSCPSIMSEGK